jgi:hypothetical protein
VVLLVCIFRHRSVFRIITIGVYRPASLSETTPLPHKKSHKILFCSIPHLARLYSYEYTYRYQTRVPGVHHSIFLYSIVWPLVLNSYKFPGTFLYRTIYTKVNCFVPLFPTGLYFLGLYESFCTNCKA